MAFSKSLEEVIEAALADGVITEKERAVLHKKALLEGVDPDEVDVVIDGRLQQMKQKEFEEEERRNASKQKKHECPFCHKEIPYMSAVCPNCGRVLDTSNPDNKALKEYMDKLEKTLVSVKTNYDTKAIEELRGMIRQGRTLYGENKRINSLISDIETSFHQKEKEVNKGANMVIIIVVILWILIIIFGVFENKIEYWLSENKVDTELVEQARVQSDSLCAIIDNLPIPNEDNYKECERKLITLCWKKIANDEGEVSTYKEMYLTKKRAYAEMIGAVEIDGMPYEYDASDVIRRSDLIEE